MMAALLLAVLPSCAQKKEIDEARTLVKSGKDLKKAEKLMTDLLAKDSANRQNPKVFATWFETVEAQYAQANEKLYLKQKYDTTAFFNLTRRLYDIALTLDTLDGRPNKKGKVKYEYRKANGEVLNQLRPNLYYGGTYHVRKEEYADAFSFLSHYMDAAQQPLFAAYRYAETDSMLPQAAYWATYCGYRMRDAECTLRYSEEALKFTPRAQYVLQYLCDAYQLQDDQQRYIETLKPLSGISLFLPASGRLLHGTGHERLVDGRRRLWSEGQCPLFTVPAGQVYGIAEHGALRRVHRHQPADDYRQ